MNTPKPALFQAAAIDRDGLLGDQVSPGYDSFDLSPLLLQYWQAIVRWRLLVAGIVAGCLILGLLVTLFTAPSYTARSQIEVSREKKNVTNVEGLDSQQEGRDLEFYATQYALLKSDTLAERVARKLKLTKSDAFFAAHGVKPYGSYAEAGKDRRKIAEIDRERANQVTELLKRNVSIDPIRTSRLIDVKYTSRSAELSAKVANVWVQEFIGASMDRAFASTADARRFLEAKLGELRNKVEQSERDLVTYASGQNIVTLDTVRDSDGRTYTQRTLASADLEAMNDALAKAQADRVTAQSRLATSGAENSPEVLNNPAIATMRARRAELASDYARLLVQFDPQYPGAMALKEQIDSLDTAIAQQAARFKAGRQQDYREALSREQELTAKVESLKHQLAQQRNSSIQYNIYQREVDTNRQLYDALLQRYKEIGVAGTVGTSNIAVVDVAQVPLLPSAPSMKLNLALALLAGLGLAGLAVFGLEQIDEGIRRPDDVRNFLQLPLLGNVPMSAENPLEQLLDSKSHLSESYYSLFSTLAFSTNHGLPRTCIVTSTQPGEGKSTTAYSLAEIISRTGKRVLLIDGDLRSPSVHRMAGVSNEAGLSNLLAGDDVSESMIKEVGGRGLSVITAGPIPPAPAELMSGGRFGEVLGILLQRFDHVVVDAPPVLGLADAPLMGRATEGVVFVVEAERTSRRASRMALQRLRALGDHIFGAVVTKVDYNRHSYGYGYGYGYSYDYAYGQQKDAARAGA